jgi:putative flippase GtrA
MPSVWTSESFARWLRFNVVGLMGVAVQLAVLALLMRGFRWNYLVATVVAVECAVVHNFLWHERFTWGDRHHPHIKRRLLRFLRFNIANGLVSIAGNMAFMYVLVGKLRVPFLAANLIAIAACALINFFLSDRVVFTISEKPGDSLRR